MRYQKTRASEQKIPQFLGRKAEGEALRNITRKLSEERNLRDFHLKRYHMSTAQFKKRTTHLDIPGTIYDLYEHVVKTYPFCNSRKPRPERSRVSGIRAEVFGDFVFSENVSAKIGDETFGFLINFGWSHITFDSTFPCKSASASEVIAKIHERVDTFQMMWLSAIFTTRRHSDRMQREENSNRTTSTMAEPSKDGCTTVQDISLGTGGYRLQKAGSDHSGTNYSCSVDAQGSKGEKYTGGLMW